MSLSNPPGPGARARTNPLPDNNTTSSILMNNTALRAHLDYLDIVVMKPNEYDDHEHEDDVDLEVVGVGLYPNPPGPGARDDANYPRSQPRGSTDTAEGYDSLHSPQGTLELLASSTALS